MVLLRLPPLGERPVLSGLLEDRPIERPVDERGRDPRGQREGASWTLVGESADSSAGSESTPGPTRPLTCLSCAEYAERFVVASSRGSEPNGSTVALPGYENFVPCLSLQCNVCGWFRWGHTQDSLDRAYAVHLNDDRHFDADRASREREDRITAYQLADLAERRQTEHGL